MPKTASPKPDSWAVNPDGTLTLTIDSTDYTLRRPKHGEQRRFDEELLKIQVLEQKSGRAEMEAVKDNVEDVLKIQAGDIAQIPADRMARLVNQATRIDPEEAAKRRFEIEDARIAWWTEHVIPTLCNGSKPDLDPDGLPSFFASAEILNQARLGWAGNPQAPGAS